MLRARSWTFTTHTHFFSSAIYHALFPSYLCCIILSSHHIKRESALSAPRKGNWYNLSRSQTTTIGTTQSTEKKLYYHFLSYICVYFHPRQRYYLCLFAELMTVALNIFLATMFARASIKKNHPASRSMKNKKKNEEKKISLWCRAPLSSISFFASAELLPFYVGIRRRKRRIFLCTWKCSSLCGCSSVQTHIYRFCYSSRAPFLKMQW